MTCGLELAHGATESRKCGAWRSSRGMYAGPSCVAPAGAQGKSFRV